MKYKKLALLLCISILITVPLSSCNNSDEKAKQNQDGEISSISEVDNEYPYFSKNAMLKVLDGRLKSQYKSFASSKGIDERLMLFSIYQIMEKVNTFNKPHDLLDTISTYHMPSNVINHSDSQENKKMVTDYLEICYMYYTKEDLASSANDILGDNPQEEYVQDEAFNNYIRTMQDDINNFIDKYIE